MTVFEGDSTLPEFLNLGKDIPFLWRVRNSGNEDAVGITLTLGKIDLNLKMPTRLTQIPWPLLPSGADTDDQKFYVKFRASDLNGFLVLCYGYSRGFQTYNEADFVKLRRLEEPREGRTFALFPLLRATREYGMLRAASLCAKL